MKEDIQIENLNHTIQDLFIDGNSISINLLQLDLGVTKKIIISQAIRCKIHMIIDTLQSNKYDIIGKIRIVKSASSYTYDTAIRLKDMRYLEYLDIMFFEQHSENILMRIVASKIIIDDVEM